MNNLLGRDNGVLMSNNALIEVVALNRYYGNHHVVKDYNLTLRKGEVLGLLGPNGAGKSTTMQMLTGNISPSSGDIKINGIDLIEDPQQAKYSIGYLPEQPPIYRDMTPREFLKYCAVLHDISKSNHKKFIDLAVDRCGLKEMSNRLIGNLSKGFQQRVGIAQAILHQPEIVILDEPTVGLDPIQILQIRELIRELGKDHSVVLSSHILPEVQAVCDRVQIINQGATVFSDTFSQLESRQHTSFVSVGFEEGGDKQSLEKLVGVENVEAFEVDNNKTRFLLRYAQSSSSDPDTSKIYQLAVAKNWKLNELSIHKETLEQIFMDLIHGEVAQKKVGEQEKAANE